MIRVFTRLCFGLSLWVTGLPASRLFAQTPPSTGIRGEIAYVGDLMGAARGGRSGAWVYLDNLDLFVSLDLQALVGLRGASIQAHVQSNRGASLSSVVGDFQGASNIEASREWRLYELWFEQNVIPGRLSVLAGVYDLNSEFDVVPAAADFVNSSFGIGPDYGTSGLAGPPIFPSTTLALRLKTRPWNHAYAGIAVSDGAPGDPARPERSRLALGGGEGALLSWELGYRRDGPEADAGPEEPTGRVDRSGRSIGRGRTAEHLRTKVGLGGWVYTRSFAAWNGADDGSDWGAYALAQQVVAETASGLELAAFGRIGLSDPRTSRVRAYAGAGLALTGPLPSRPDDRLGLGVAHARNGDPFLEARRSEGRPLTRAETVLEAYYAVQIGPGFRLQPDLQWILDPGMAPERPNAVVVGVRGLATLSVP